MSAPGAEQRHAPEQQRPPAQGAEHCDIRVRRPLPRHGVDQIRRDRHRREHDAETIGPGVDELPMVLPQQPGRSQESEHQRRDHREEPRRQVALRLHRHLPIEHVLIARFPIRSGRDRGHRGAGGIVHLLGPGQLDERRRKIGHLHQPRLPGRRRGQQTRGLTRPQHHRRLHRRALVRSVGDG